MRFTGRPTFAIIDRVAIRSNFLQIKKNVDKGVDILAVVKANAYGHGAVETAKTLEQSGCRFFGVAICEEGVE